MGAKSGIYKTCDKIETSVGLPNCEAAIKIEVN